MQALVTELSSDAGVAQFVAPSGGRERCSFGRAAVLAAGGAPLPEGQPLTRLLQVGAAVTCDCQRSSVVAGCRYVADKVSSVVSVATPRAEYAATYLTYPPFSLAVLIHMRHRGE